MTKSVTVSDDGEFQNSITISVSKIRSIVIRESEYFNMTEPELYANGHPRNTLPTEEEKKNGVFDVITYHDYDRISKTNTVRSRYRAFKWTITIDVIGRKTQERYFTSHTGPARYRSVPDPIHLKYKSEAKAKAAMEILNNGENVRSQTSGPCKNGHKTGKGFNYCPRCGFQLI